MRGVSYLAFAAGYRRVSFVFVEDGQLATWQTSKQAARTPELAASFAQEFIELLVPTVIVMEDLETATRKGETARELIAAMQEKAREAKCPLIVLAKEKLFRTRFDEAKYLVSLYPEFEDKLPRRRFYEREPHHMVLFEALALAHTALQGGALLLAQKM